MGTRSGEIVYRFYRALTYGISPLIRLHLQWRRFRGREHPLRWPERVGRPSALRPDGRLVWFHAVSLGEGLAAIPVIKCCLEKRPDVAVLMTTTTTSAFEVIKKRLPSNVIYQFAPLDIPSSMDAFLKYWRPDAVMLMESELWPNLIMGAARNGVPLALLNGRMSTKSFQKWSHPLLLPLISLLLSKFTLILPLSTAQGINFQLLQAPLFSISYSGDLKYAIAEFGDPERDKIFLEEFKAPLSCRKVWMASSIHKGEEEVFIGAHNMLRQMHANILTIIVPRQPQCGQYIAQKLREQGFCVSLRSHGDYPTTETSVYVVDSLGELRNFYGSTPIAVIGGSFVQGSAGHNISEAAAAGCAILTGHHVGHFSHMVAEMQRVNPLSVLQVSGENLVEAINELLSNVKILEARRAAARQAFRALSNGVVESVWEMLKCHVFIKSMIRDGCNGTKSQA
ncbi:Probable 3-deoxy-D-manno-octulosonic acid transferase- mitochondrial [Striga hermonthica]|uniref:lipid IVA 3-deoxy-D-manno-octulosonic acid transferase n=1 Tax=Striga hermonthica TaxID=68872 RepID=A0A9N7NAG2_STRHE|nr:Probable 3-deoxy-D-manno-octulosonic acid transferase- mitochondrial [Striga hermonthica]